MSICRAPGGVHGPEVEVVIADGRRGVPHGVEGVDDQRAFAEIGFDAPLERVARIEQQHGTAIGLPGCAQVVEKPGQKRHPAAPVPGKDEPVQIGRPYYGQRDQAGRARRLWLTAEARRPKGAGQRQRKEP